MVLKCNNVLLTSLRTFKNFGHKPEPMAGVTVLWHGFLTFSFIGLFIDWKWLSNPIGKYMKSEDKALK